MRGHALLWRVVAIPVLAAFGLVYLFPLYWLVATSLKGQGELLGHIVPTLVPQAPTLEAFHTVLVEKGNWKLLRNSVLVCGATVLTTLTLGLLITYPITRLPVSRKVRVGVLNWALSLRFLPPVAVVVPYFGVVRTLQLYDNPLALVCIYTLFNLPFSIWMLKSFLAEVPLELEEAAFVDGATRPVAFFRVLLPLVAPGLLAAGIIIFAFAWSEFLFALILTQTPRAQTFPVGVQTFVTQFNLIWNEMAAAGLIALLVPLILMILARRYVLAGLTFGVIREK
ncbi:carbohydrate ABC transporter permease [Allomeiothermus silvanus]|uniref:carbohydrate ABC transporter permease n=1 Tax=Allomeiothermus silvanus TaxID=52022 RepID=UPI0023EF9AF4|nr:carbohydrate ABC transporter permease [Allomeiothermus silvanus]